MTVTVAGGYRARLELLTAIAQMANAANVLRSRTSARWSLQTSLLERLAEHFEDVPPALRAFVPEAHARVRPRPRARQRDRAAADPPHSR